MKLKFGVALVCATMVMTACSKSSDGVEAYTPDAKRSISEPRFGFVADGQDLKLSSLSSSEKSALSSCSQKSTASRTDRTRYTVSNGVITRMMSNGQSSIKAEYFEYKTDNKGETYELTTALTEYVIQGRGVLADGGITYVDSCTSSSGCDQEKRKFVTGSGRYLIAIKDRESAVSEEIRREGTKSECRLTKPKEELDQVQKGVIRMGEVSYPAIQVIKKSSGKIYCRSNYDDLYLGEGVQISKLIVLQDELVLAKDSAGLARTNSFSSCGRTVTFVSEELQFEGATVNGASSELVDYQLSADVTSLEAWNKKQKNIKQRISELQNEITVNRASLDRAQVGSAQAEADVKATESKLAELKVKLNEAITGKLPTEESLRTNVQDAEKSVEKARISLDSAKNLVVISQNKLKSSEDALNSYIKENGNGEN